MTRSRSRAYACRAARALVGLVVLAAATGLGVDTAGAQVEAPQRGEPFAVVWMAVGDVREINLSPGFTGIVDSYRARSDNEEAVSVSVAGSIVSLTAEAAGVAFIEVTASNDADDLAQWIGAVSAAAPTTLVDEMAADTEGDAGEGSVTGGETQPLEIAVVAPAYCWGSQVEEMIGGREHEGITVVSRSEVERFDLSYSVIGGESPYTVTSPDAAESSTSQSGVLSLACGVPAPGTGEGSERTYFHWRSGPVTVAVIVTDADGTTARAEVIVHVSSGLITVDNGDGTESWVIHVPGLADPGKSYVVGSPYAWTLLTLAPSLELRFDRLDTEGIAHFADRLNGWQVQLDWDTGMEVGRTSGAVPGTDPLVVRTTPILSPGQMDGMDPAPPDYQDPTAPEE